MEQAALMLIAATAFAGVAFLTGWNESRRDCPQAVEVVRYFPAPEPQPIYEKPKLLPVSEIGPPAVEATEPKEEAEKPEPEHVRHIRRHHRRWRRH